jgi:hypothetical protein
MGYGRNEGIPAQYKLVQFGSLTLWDWTRHEPLILLFFLRRLLADGILLVLLWNVNFKKRFFQDISCSIDFWTDKAGFLLRQFFREEGTVYVFWSMATWAFWTVHQEFYYNFVEKSYTFQLIPSHQTLENRAAVQIPNIHMKANSALAIIRRQVALPM